MSASLKRFPLKETNLFKPIKLGECLAQHRVVLPPLTRYRCDNYTPTDLVADYYEQRSKRPGTFMISEGTFISAQAGGCIGVPGIYDDSRQKAWSKVISKIHKNNSFIFIQLWGLGRQADPVLLANEGNYPFVSASGIYESEASKIAAIKANRPLRPLTKIEINQYIEDYVSSSIRAIKAGADGVEIHSANSYLLDQFIQEISNKRTDEYGGSIENRSRLLLEIIDKVINEIGSHRVGVRFSPWGKFGGMGWYNQSPIPQYSYILKELEKKAQMGKRLAYVHFVEPRVSNFKLVSSETEGSNNFIYDHWKGNVIRAGNYTNDYEATKRDVNSNDRTLIAYGRFFTSNPDLPNRLEKGLPLTPYNRDQFYKSGPGGFGYTDYPTYEQIIMNEETQAKKISIGLTSNL
ncbi:hypothetical protein PACTADRAFT_50558 [Pachysolen tannophilus NRRL Y-2460]|uniref:Probable NADPH dehydrogenase n=1 Tax=Pachysolen tannophilus NRRL Y-2460 TaxID=669874 RepID=A0A1E4TSI3_PACTA|nr:hypothetical protein PACTADRAFT_50558 [Pachysolen tannophilus NRRL Y-2460]